MAGKASGIFGGGGVPIGAIVQGQFAADASYLLCDGSTYTSASYPLLDKTKLISYGTSAWALKTLPATAVWNKVIYGNGTFLAFVSGSTAAATSTDGGNTWTARTLANLACTDGIYANGLFVLVGSGGTIQTSPDGITWTARTSGTTYLLNGIDYGNGIFVISMGQAEQSSSQIATSTDGVTWTLRNVSGTPFLGSPVSFLNGKFYLPPYSHSASNAPSFIYISPDGINWTSKNLYQVFSWTTGAVGNYWQGPILLFKGLYIIGYSSNVTYVGMDDSMRVDQRYLAGIQYTALNVANGAMFASPNGSNAAYLWYTLDYKNWQTITMPSATSWANGRKTVAYGNGVYVCINSASSNQCAVMTPDTTKFVVPMVYGPDITTDHDRYYIKAA